jgi:Rrf2 family transcriptional regulator, iron-sulfur cluster assembly transcription factor
MPQLFSKSCEYALQSVLFLARHRKRNPILLREISDSLYLPYHVLSKTMQNLARHGILSSSKGMNGGYNLSRKPSEISLKDIVQAIDGDNFLTKCVLGFPKCGDHNPCPVHDQWSKAKIAILDMLYRKNIEELSQNLDTKINLIETLIERCCENKENNREVHEGTRSNKYS